MIGRLGGVLAALACLLLLSAPAHAANHYRVELIVFRNLQAPARTNPLPPIIPGTSNAVDLNNQTALRNNGIQVSAGGLGGIWRVLSNSQHYHPMLRVSWTQTGRSPADAVPLRLHDGKTYMLDTPQDNTRQVYHLDGTATLLTQPYLHLSLNLVLLQPGQSLSGQTGQSGPSMSSGNSMQGSGTGNASPALVAYHLRANQALKSGNVRYFDNPAFGVIAKVTQLH